MVRKSVKIPARLAGCFSALLVLATLTLGNSPVGCGQKAADMYCRQAYTDGSVQQACLSFCPEYRGFKNLREDDKAGMIDACQLGQASVLKDPLSADALLLQCEEQFKAEGAKVWACQLGIGAERTRLQRDHFGNANDRETGN